MKQRKDSVSPRHGLYGHISKDYGVSACWNGGPEAEELCNTVSLILGGRVFDGSSRRVAECRDEKLGLGVAPFRITRLLSDGCEVRLARKRPPKLL
jgi:hypothetical protein